MLMDLMNLNIVNRVGALSNFTYELKKHIASLSPMSKGWNKELNLVSWNGYEPKYDIRDWDSSHTKMGKGVTLSEEELKELYLALKEMFEKENVEEKEPLIKKYNVQDVVQSFSQYSPSFIQEIKSVVRYMNESGYSEEAQRSLLIGSYKGEVEEALINEIDSMRMMYSVFYHKFTNLLEEFNEDELELFLLLVINE